MPLNPYTSDLASGAVANELENFDVPVLGRRGLILAIDVTAVGTDHSYVEGADISTDGVNLTVPLVVGTNSNSQFSYNSNVYTLANGTYSTLAALITAIGAATSGAASPFSTVVTTTISTSGNGLRFTSVPSGVNTDAFATGTHDALASLGITNGWTIAHTYAALADGTCHMVVTIEGKDETSGLFYTILTSAAITGTGFTVLQVHPNMAAVANTTATSQLPLNVRVNIVKTSNVSITRTIGLQLTA